METGEGEAVVEGLTADGSRLLLRVRGDSVSVSVSVPLEDIRRAERQAARRVERQGDRWVSQDEPLSPRVIQQRIRCGESAAQVAAAGGWPVESVRRYEGPPLAEREHHAGGARRSEVDGRIVEDLVSGYLRMPAEDVDWDAWLVEDGRWEVQASAAGQSVRLRWDPAVRRAHPVDEPARRALRVASVDDDALTAVLRPVSGGPAAEVGGGAAPTAGSRSGRRAEIPGWADIARQVTGRDPEQD